jgi:hypothetical protein
MLPALAGATLALLVLGIRNSWAAVVDLVGEKT